MSFSKEISLSPNSWCWQPQNLGTNASSCNQERGTEVLLKKYRGTYVKRFAPRTAQAGTVRRAVRKWNLGLPLCQYPLLCISAGAEPMERALIHGALPTTLKYCGKHIQGHQPEAVAESPGNPSCVFGLRSSRRVRSLHIFHFCLTSTLAALGSFSVPLLILFSFTAQPLLQDLI